MIHWTRRNLFAKPFDAVLSLIVIPFCAWVLWLFATWVLTVAEWGVVRDSMRVLMVGVFPADQLWRAWCAAALISAMLGLTCGDGFRLRRDRALTVTAIVLALAAGVGTWSLSGATGILVCGAALLSGWAASSFVPVVRRATILLWIACLVATFAVLAPVGISSWGGLLLSVLITLVASALILPLGVLLALGKRSRIASVRICSSAYIELMRSVPVILIVYWVWVVLPLLMPSVPIPDVVRGMIGFVLFYSAVAAEFVRSGLQSVPRGQVEAARSLGLSDFEVNRSIVLPQALRVSVPGLVGNVLDIFNFAPLVFIIGLTDFLRAGQMILANPQYSGNVFEVYVFLFATYFAIGSTITFLARRLEAHLGKGAKS